MPISFYFFIYKCAIIFTIPSHYNHSPLHPMTRLALLMTIRPLLSLSLPHLHPFLRPNARYHTKSHAHPSHTRCSCRGSASSGTFSTLKATSPFQYCRYLWAPLFRDHWHSISPSKWHWTNQVPCQWISLQCWGLLESGSQFVLSSNNVYQQH